LAPIAAYGPLPSSGTKVLLLYVYYVAAFEDTNFLAVFNAETNSLTLFRFRVEYEHVRNIHRHRVVFDTTCFTDIRVRLNVLLREVYALDQHAIIIKNLKHSATTALVLSGRYDDFVAFFNLVHIVISRAGRAPTQLSASALRVQAK
jgi:hypothetical protein